MNIKQRIKKDCLICGKPLMVLPSGINKKYCSNHCKWKSREKNYEKQCPECGIAFVAHLKTQKCCSQSCAKIQRYKNREKKKPRFRICGHCGKTYYKKHYRVTIFCSKQCAMLYQGKNLRNATPKSLWRSGVSGRRHEIRAKERGLEYERFKPIEIFERDKYICGICHEKINKDLKYPDPLCVSLDHFVPISKGGKHTKENTRAVHLICNMNKGDK